MWIKYSEHNTPMLSAAAVVGPLKCARSICITPFLSAISDLEIGEVGLRWWPFRPTYYGYDNRVRDRSFGGPSVRLASLVAGRFNHGFLSAASPPSSVGEFRGTGERGWTGGPSPRAAPALISLRAVTSVWRQ